MLPRIYKKTFQAWEDEDAMNKSVALISLFCLSFFGGCAYITHYEEAQALKSFSDNQGKIEKYIQWQEESFYRLRDDLVNGRLKPGITKGHAISVYAEPVFCIDVRKNAGERCLYRHPTRYFSTDLIYLRFDQGLLSSWEFYPAR